MPLFVYNMAVISVWNNQDLKNIKAEILVITALISNKIIIIAEISNKIITIIIVEIFNNLTIVIILTQIVPIWKISHALNVNRKVILPHNVQINLYKPLVTIIIPINFKIKISLEVFQPIIITIIIKIYLVPALNVVKLVIGLITVLNKMEGENNSLNKKAQIRSQLLLNKIKIMEKRNKVVRFAAN